MFAVTHSPTWQRSTFCADKSCVEVAKDGDTVLVGDGKDPGPALSFTMGEWAAFVAGVKAGEFWD